MMTIPCIANYVIMACDEQIHLTSGLVLQSTHNRMPIYFSHPNNNLKHLIVNGVIVLRQKEGRTCRSLQSCQIFPIFYQRKQEISATMVFQQFATQKKLTKSFIFLSIGKTLNPMLLIKQKPKSIYYSIKHKHNQDNNQITRDFGGGEIVFYQP